MPNNGKIEKFRSSIAKWGWVPTLRRLLLTRLERYLGLHIHLIRLTTMKSDPKLPETPDHITFRLVSPDELAETTRNPDLLLSREFVSSAAERGDMMFGAFDGNVLVSYVWRTMTPAPYSEKLWIKVPSPYCYCYNSYTLPDYRGKRLSPANHLVSDAAMTMKGYTHRVGFVSLSNYSSLAMGKYMGSGTLGYTGYIAWFGRHLSFRTRAVRKIGLELFQRD